MRFPFLGILLLTLFFAAAPNPAFAEQPAPDPATEEARKYYQQGAAAAKNKDWNTAYEAFAKAWKYKKHWQISANLGRAAHELKKHRRAAEHLAIFLRQTDPDIPEEEKTRARAWFAEARKHVGAISVSVTEAGREVLVDASPVGQSPLPGEVFVDPGSHDVSATLTGCVATAKVDVGAGESKGVSLRCPGTTEPPPSATIAPTGAPESTPSAAPTPSVSQAPSNMPVSPTATGPDVPKTSVPRLPLMIAGAGLTAAGIVVGAVGIGLATGKADEMNAIRDNANARGAYTPGELEQMKALDSDRVLLGNLGVTGFAVAGVVAAGTLGFVLLTAPSGPKPKSTSKRKEPSDEYDIYYLPPAGVRVGIRF